MYKNLRNFSIFHESFKKERDDFFRAKIYIVLVSWGKFSINRYNIFKNWPAVLALADSFKWVENLLPVNLQIGAWKMEPLEKMRRLVPDQFHSLVKMHLSFLTDLKYDDCDCNFVYEATPSTPSKSKGIFSASATPRRSKNSSNAYKGVMEGAPLTMEGVCQVSQIIEYLKRNLHIEGLFRSVKRIQRSTLFNNDFF